LGYLSGRFLDEMRRFSVAKLNRVSKSLGRYIDDSRAWIVG
jgi:hypothetical protein